MTINLEHSEFILSEDFYSSINTWYYSPGDFDGYHSDISSVNYCKNYLGAAFSRKRNKNINNYDNNY